jgi:excisionase family DNA binding protein
MKKKHLTVAEAAATLNISPRTVRQWISDGKLAAKRHGKAWDIDAESVATHLPASDSADVRHESADACRVCEQKQSEIEHLRAELAAKNRQLESHAQQIDHLTQVVAMAQKNASMLTEQLGTERQLLEDMRSRRGFWRRWFRRDALTH